jgi:hypothetical protein
MSRLLLAALLLLVPFTASAGGGLAPKKASDIVTVSQTGQPCPGGGGYYVLDDRQLPTGQSVSFAIPPGKVLILTGVTWSAVSGTPGAPVIGLLSSQAPGTSLVSHHYSSATFASDGTVFETELTPPAVIAPGRSICFSVTAGSFNAASLHGFLVPDK